MGVGRTSRYVMLACACACGDVATAADAGDAAAFDATSEGAIDAGDGSPFADATPPVVDCSDASDYVEAVGDAGAFVLTAGCGYAATPTATIAGCSDKVQCLYVSGCGGGGSIVLASIDGWTPGSTHTTTAMVSFGDASALDYFGWIIISAWPDAGGVVPGAFGVGSQDAGTLNGVFCVTRR